MAGFDGVDAEFTRRVQAMMRDAPGSVGIVSGYRSVAEQQVLYNSYLAGTGNLAAPPGKSNHNHGTALDISFSSPEVQNWVHQNAARYGLGFPVPGEPWHIEPVGGGDMGHGFEGAESDVPTAGYSGAPPQTGEDIQKAIMRSLGATPDEAGVGGQEGNTIGAGTAGLDPSIPQPGNAPAEFSTGVTGVDGIVQAAKNAGFQGEELRTMVAIAIGESGGNAGAINDTGMDRSVGLWQINQLAHGDTLGTRDELMNPFTNAAAARTLFDQSGFKPWTVYTSGRYLNHLGEADAAIGRS